MRRILQHGFQMHRPIPQSLQIAERIFGIIELQLDARISVFQITARRGSCSCRRGRRSAAGRGW